jgi:hypothetical protein
MIYREMPPLWDASFRERFYSRWGRESAAISASARHAEYPDYTQLLSVKVATGGSEDYFVDGRRLRVDDHTFLVLNDGRRYASLINALQPVHSFSVFSDRASRRKSRTHCVVRPRPSSPTHCPTAAARPSSTSGCRSTTPR